MAKAPKHPSQCPLGLLALLCLVLLTAWGPAGALALRPLNAIKQLFMRRQADRTLVDDDVVSPRMSKRVARAGARTTSSSAGPSSRSPLMDPAVATVFAPGAVRSLPRLQEAFAAPRLRSDEDGTESDGQLDPAKAMFAGSLASIAYCSSPQVLEAWNCTRCGSVPGFLIQHVVYDPVWDLVGYVGFHPPSNQIVAVFRGTDSSNWGNWAENMKSWRTDHMYPVPDFPKSPHALIHAGFYMLWSDSDMEPQVTAAVGELVAKYPSAQLLTVGHSMGAALAQLAALELKFVFNFTYVSSYTFGAPRVGNYDYQQLYNTYIDESWRFTHNRDIVPSVPLQLMGFHHVAREVWVVDVEVPAPPGSNSSSVVEHKMLVCDETGEDPSCHNSACYLGLCTSVADHLEYIGLHMYWDADEC